MLDLHALTQTPRTENVLIRGTPVAVRALTLAELVACEAAFERPAPPLVKDPNRGSAAPSIANVNDPDFVVKRTAYDVSVNAAAVAVAVDLNTGSPRPSPDDPAFKAWAVMAAKRINNTLSDGEIAGTYAVSKRLGSLGDLVAEAAKK